MMKRQRGRGRNPGQKPQNNNPNRAYESNGPDLKVRGSAQTVFEKYQQLGRDAMSNGDRVLGENYMQHAEHYFRVLRAMQPTFVPRSELMIAGYDDEEFEGDENAAQAEGSEAEGGEGQPNGGQPEFQQNRQRDNRDRDGRDRDFNRDRGPREFRDNRDRDNREPREPREPRDPNEPRAEGDEGRYGRRRRRDRFGRDGEGPSEGGEHQQEGRYEGRRDNRPDYRGDNRSESQPAPVAPVEGFPQPEFVQPTSFSDPQEIIVTTDAPPPRERRPRPPRAPRVPREDAPVAAEAGFGADLPAFLSTPVPVTTGE